jgi:hypothetical protein
VRTGPARAGLAFTSLALGLFAVTVLLATLEALQRQARGWSIRSAPVPWS